MVKTKDDRVFQPDDGPRWGLTPRGRQAARVLLVTVVLGLLAAGFVAGVVVTALVLR